jgi:plasmid stabilization system protein ParE
MSVNVFRTTSSHKDLRRILDYFLDQNEPGVGSRFADAFEETLKFIADFPELGIPWESDETRLKNLRVRLVQGFEKYLVFYRLRGECVYILRIFHGHQDIANLL